MPDIPELLAQLEERRDSLARYCEDQYRADEARRKELAEEKADGLPLCDVDHKWQTFYKGEWIALDTNGKAIRVNVKL